jgi:hypothetical protein
MAAAKKPKIVIKPTTRPNAKPKAATKSMTNPKPMTPAQRQAQAKRPAVGNDKAVAKKAGKGSWNNGYTN